MPPKPNNARKARLYNSRAIKTQLSDPSFVDKEKLNIPEFLEARSFEIKSFEISQLNSKAANSNRVFQRLPRNLRRRAASHNIKRIPKRLHNRALKEMKNSVNGLPPKKAHLRGRKLYKLKTSRKLLKLSARLKLLREVPKSDMKKLNIRGTIKALGEQIKESMALLPQRPKLNNILGSYDNTGVGTLAPKPRGNLKYQKRQREHVWLPTHVWHAKRAHMIKQYGYQIPLAPTQKSFKLMHRQSKSGSILFDTSYLDAMVIEIPDPRDFTDFLINITKYDSKIPQSILNGKKTYNDWIQIPEKIGKAFIYSNISQGKILIRVFPSIYEELFEVIKSKLLKSGQIYDCRYSLGSISIIGPKAINSLSKILHLVEPNQTWTTLSKINDVDIIPVGTTFGFDIRDPRYWKKPSNLPGPKDYNINDVIIALNTQDLVNPDSISTLLDSEGRYNSYEEQMSIKQISKKFGSSSPLENSVPQDTIELSRIPILISKISTNEWNLTLPWYWVLPTWIKLIAVRDIKVGGLKQIHQINYENNKPTFPQDYPWLRDGWTYNETLAKLNEAKYDKLPSHLLNKTRPDFREPQVLSPFKCDWEAIRNVAYLKKLGKPELSKEAGFASFDFMTLERDINTIHDLKMVLATVPPSHEIAIELYNKENPEHQRFVDGSFTPIILQEIKTKKIPVIQIAIELVKEGRVRDGARVYAKQEVDQIDETDAIGFITSGTFNLNIGRETGIGLVSAQALNQQGKEVYIRNIGQSTYYLANISEI